eukprot:1468627-Karenia_brevis.AAC.1
MPSSPKGALGGGSLSASAAPKVCCTAGSYSKSVVRALRKDTPHQKLRVMDGKKAPCVYNSKRPRGRFGQP